MYKKILSILLICVMLFSLCGCNIKNVEFSRFEEKFSPFFAVQAEDLSVADMTQATLIVKDAVKQTIINDAATEGLGISNVEFETVGKKTAVTIKLMPDVKFSDGKPLTADDVIFSMYVYADPDYEGWCPLFHSDIQGLNAYRYGKNYTDDVEFTDEQYEAELKTGAVDAIIVEKIIKPVLETEMEWVKNSYNDAGYNGTELEQYMQKYPEAKDLFAYLYSVDENYDSAAVADADTVLADVIGQYGADYALLGQVMGLDLTQSAYLCAKDSLAKKLGGEDVDRISGIEKIDEYTVRVTFINRDETNIEEALAIFVAPLHYYGDESAYDYDNAKFGFTKGDLTSVREKDGNPVGAGEYVMKSYKEGKGVSFSKNKNYFCKTKNPSDVFFEETGNSNADKSHGFYVNSAEITCIEISE